MIYGLDSSIVANFCFLSIVLYDKKDNGTIATKYIQICMNVCVFVFECSTRILKEGKWSEQIVKEGHKRFDTGSSQFVRISMFLYYICIYVGQENHSHSSLGG